MAPRAGNEHGHQAYEATPLTGNLLAVAMVALVSSVLVLGIRESAGFNAVMVPIKRWRLFPWLAAGLLIYALYGRHHSTPGRKLRRKLALHGASPAGGPGDA